MYYQNYEDYMRAVLGYAGNERNYTYDDYYQNPRLEQQEVENLYPEIYRIVNPAVENECNKHRNMPITEDLVKAITEEVYNNVERNTTTHVNVAVKTELKNGDVRNPNAKTTAETRQRNFLLNDLIRILVIRKLLGNMPPMRPPVRPPHQGERPPFPGHGGNMPIYGPRPPVM